MDLGLRGRAAFVAASSKGMGRAIAEQFAAEGADVGMCARTDSALQTAAESVRTHGVRVVATPADVADAQQARVAVERAVNDFGRLDALVVNAGGPPRGSFNDIDGEMWEAAHQLTFMSAIHLIQAALPALRESDAAAILFITSTSVKQPISGLTLSNSIRGSVSGLAKTSRDRTCAADSRQLVAPGAIRTDRQIEVARAAGLLTSTRSSRARARSIHSVALASPRRFARGRVSLLAGGVIRHGRFPRRRRRSDPVRRLTRLGRRGRQQVVVVLRIAMMLGRLNSACVRMPGTMLLEP